MDITAIWNLLFLDPMLNSLVVLNNLLFGNFGLAIIFFTIIVRFLLLPLTIKQMKAMKVMSELTPKLQEVQKKYKDPQQRAEAQMKLYRQYGVNPVGCLWPMAVQFPIWIGLYYGIMQALASTPEALLALAGHLYAWPPLHQAIPLEERFLWMNLARPDPLPVMAFLVGITMWVQQKMTAMPSADEKQASMNQMMQWFMPAMFAVFTLSFPSGLALYWVVSTVVGIIQQYPVTGWGSLRFSRPFGPTPTASPAPDKGSTPSAAPAGENPSPVIGEDHGKPGDKRKDRGRSR